MPSTLGRFSQPLALVLLDGGCKKGIIVKPVYIHNYGLAPGVVVFQAFWATLGCHLARECRRHVPDFRLIFEGPRRGPLIFSLIFGCQSRHPGEVAKGRSILNSVFRRVQASLGARPEHRALFCAFICIFHGLAGARP